MIFNMRKTFAAVCVAAVAIAPAMANEMPSFAGEGVGIAYFNVPNRDPVPIHQTEPTTAASVNLTVDEESDVLVQFTSGIAVDTGEGCPCSVRALLQVDDQEPIVVKRINIGSPMVQHVDGYDHDRQSVDGSYVFRVSPGEHRFSLVYLQVAGSSELHEAYYTNMQAVAFTAK